MQMNISFQYLKIFEENFKNIIKSNNKEMSHLFLKLYAWQSAGVLHHRKDIQIVNTISECKFVVAIA